MKADFIPVGIKQRQAGPHTEAAMLLVKGKYAAAQALNPGYSETVRTAFTENAQDFFRLAADNSKTTDPDKLRIFQKALDSSALLSEMTGNVKAALDTQKELYKRIPSTKNLQTLNRFFTAIIKNK